VALNDPRVNDMEYLIGSNGQIHPSRHMESCVAQQTRLSLGLTVRLRSHSFFNGQQQDSHVLMPHNSTVWLFRISCDKTFMKCLVCDEIHSWLCVYGS